jgi:hypothetical protein
MSRAAQDLELAVRALAGRGPQRERLYHAYSYTLASTPGEDFPPSVRAEFAEWQKRLAVGAERLMAHLDRLSDEQVDALVRDLLRFHATVIAAV